MLALSSVVGKPKAKVAEQVVKDIYPYISTNFIQTKVDEDNVVELMKGHDIVVEAVDDMPSRVIIHRTARELGIPSVGMSGVLLQEDLFLHSFQLGFHMKRR